MFSVASLENQKLSKDQMKELLMLIAEQENTEDNAKPGPEGSKSNKEHHHQYHQAQVKKTHSKVSKSSTVKSKTKSKVITDHEEDDEELGFLKCLCCPRKRRTQTTDKQTIAIWKNKYCSTFEEFIALMGKITKNTRCCIPGFSEIKREISYTDDPAAQAQGLSTLGGLMWLLTYGIQHLIDPTKSSSFLPKAILEIRGVYQDIGSASQKFAVVAEKFSTNMTEIHEIVEDVIKKLTKKFKFTKDPFQLHPQFRPRRVRVRRRIGYEPEEEEESKEEEEEELFQANWSPLTVVVQYPHEDEWEIYAAIPVEDKISIFKMYIKHVFDKLESWTDKFNSSKNAVTAPSTMNAGVPRKTSKSLPDVSPLFEVASAMQEFMKNYVKPKTDPVAKELESIQLVVEDFWIHMDSLYELSYELMRFIQETRDIIRTCYVYATNFYQWKLANFDTFDPRAKTKEFRTNQKQTKQFLAKIMGQRRFSDAAMFISLADFTSSIYQHTAQHHQFEVDGYVIKLECWENEEAETWGLVGEFAGNLGQGAINAVARGDIGGLEPIGGSGNADGLNSPGGSKSPKS